MDEAFRCGTPLADYCGPALVAGPRQIFWPASNFNLSFHVSFFPNPNSSFVNFFSASSFVATQPPKKPPSSFVEESSFLLCRDTPTARKTHRRLPLSCPLRFLTAEPEARVPPLPPSSPRKRQRGQPTGAFLLRCGTAGVSYRQAEARVFPHLTPLHLSSSMALFWKIAVALPGVENLSSEAAFWKNACERV
ncbi:uncharacterized protein LOC122022800 [Zingiber officinale]|uniref:uncharacterized protein LOC122022800 n=1 Tax=Zingiber officinale TaxID=94328 RepID=UPI001C4B78F4|nr:uncharacterized protein LOC122022800 [Zingiber officinale]